MTAILASKEAAKARKAKLEVEAAERERLMSLGLAAEEDHVPETHAVPEHEEDEVERAIREAAEEAIRSDPVKMRQKRARLGWETLKYLHHLASTESGTDTPYRRQMRMTLFGSLQLSPKPMEDNSLAHRQRRAMFTALIRAEGLFEYAQKIPEDEEVVEAQSSDDEHDSEEAKAARVLRKLEKDKADLQRKLQDKKLKKQQKQFEKQRKKDLAKAEEDKARAQGNAGGAAKISDMIREIVVAKKVADKKRMSLAADGGEVEFGTPRAEEPELVPVEEVAELEEDEEEEEEQLSEMDMEIEGEGDEAGDEVGDEVGVDEGDEGDEKIKGEIEGEEAKTPKTPKTPAQEERALQRERRKMKKQAVTVKTDEKHATEEELAAAAKERREASVGMFCSLFVHTYALGHSRAFYLFRTSCRDGRAPEDAETAGDGGPNGARRSQAVGQVRICCQKRRICRGSC